MDAEVRLTESAAAWELRTAWALRREVIVVLSKPAWLPRFRGLVEHVSATDSHAELIGADGGFLHVPLWVVAAVRRPHFHEDGPAAPRRRYPEERPRVTIQLPGQLSLPIL